MPNKRIYWQGKFIINLKNKPLILQILYKAYVIGLGKYPEKTKILNLFNK